MISKELHSRCFLDNVWLTWLRKTGVWTKNRNNKSFLRDKLKLLNSRRGTNHDRSSGPSTTQDVLRERHQLDNMSISLWVLLCEHSSLGNLIYFNSFTQRKDSEHLTNGREKKVSSWSLRPQEDNLKKRKEKEETTLLCWSLSVRLLDQTVLSNFRQLTPVCRRSYIHRKEIALLEFSPQFGYLLNLSLIHLSEADRMIEFKPTLTVTTSAVVKQTWANRALW